MINHNNRAIHKRVSISIDDTYKKPKKKIMNFIQQIEICHDIKKSLKQEQNKQVPKRIVTKITTTHKKLVRYVNNLCKENI